jgi:hypothetical protein
VSLDIGDLVAARRQFLSTVDSAIEGNTELEEYVARLEQDAATEDPEQLVEEIERFLRGR